MPCINVQPTCDQALFFRGKRKRRTRPLALVSQTKKEEGAPDRRLMCNYMRFSALFSLTHLGSERSIFVSITLSLDILRRHGQIVLCTQFNQVDIFRFHFKLTARFENQVSGYCNSVHLQEK